MYTYVEETPNTEGRGVVRKKYEKYRPWDAENIYKCILPRDLHIDMYKLLDQIGMVWENRANKLSLMQRTLAASTFLKERVVEVE